MKCAIATLAICLGLASCSSLTSTARVNPASRFVLGDYTHGRFAVQFQNASSFPVEVYLVPLGGASHSGQTVRPNENLSLKVAKNTAVVIANGSSDTATVNLKVTGDTGLSMGYTKQTR